MNPNPDSDRVFPLSGGSAPRPALRPPRLTSLVTPTPGAVLGHHEVLRAWAGNRGRPNLLTSARAPDAIAS